MGCVGPAGCWRYLNCVFTCRPPGWLLGGRRAVARWSPSSRLGVPHIRASNITPGQPSCFCSTDGLAHCLVAFPGLVIRPLLLTVSPTTRLGVPVFPVRSPPVTPYPPLPCPCWHPVLVLAAAPASRRCLFVMTPHRRIWALLEAVSGGCRSLPLLQLGPATVLVAEVMVAAVEVTVAATARMCLRCPPQQATSLTAHPRRHRRRRGRGTPMHLRGSAAAAAARGYRSPHRKGPFSHRRGLGEGAPVPAGWPVPLRPGERRVEGVPFFLTLAVGSEAGVLFPKQGNEVRLRRVGESCEEGRLWLGWCACCARG